MPVRQALKSAFFSRPAICLAALFLCAALAACETREKEPQIQSGTGARIVVDAPATPQENTPRNALKAPEAGAEIISDAPSAAETPESTDVDLNADAIRLAFCGDILLSEHVLRAYDEQGEVSGILDERLLNAGKSADLFVVNQEFPFGTGGKPAPDKQFTFRVAPERCSIFNELGIDLVSLANNHSLDYGRDCLAETFRTLELHQINYMGAGNDLARAKALQRYQIKGKTIGFLAASRVIPTYDWNASSSQSGLFTSYDPSALLEEITKAQQECDFTVVYVHWGLERRAEPEPYQSELARQCIDAGADLVVGAHPHVLQPISYYKGKPIVYSLGNYLFGSSISETMLLIAELSPDGNLRLSCIPASSKDGKTFSTGEERSLEQLP